MVCLFFSVDFRFLVFSETSNNLHFNSFIPFLFFCYCRPTTTTQKSNTMRYVPRTHTHTHTQEIHVLTSLYYMFLISIIFGPIKTWNFWIRSMWRTLGEWSWWRVDGLMRRKTRKLWCFCAMVTPWNARSPWTVSYLIWINLIKADDLIPYIINILKNELINGIYLNRRRKEAGQGRIWSLWNRLWRSWQIRWHAWFCEQFW